MREASETMTSHTEITACECGTVTGEPCQWSGDAADTLVIDYMPRWRRASHEAAGYRGIEGAGTYPANGALRIRVEMETCAPRILEREGGWAALAVTTATPEREGSETLASRMYRYDYTIIDNPPEPERVPDGFIAIEEWADGDVVGRIADVYGTDARAIKVADAILDHLGRDEPMPETDLAAR